MKWRDMYQGIKDPLIFLTALLIIVIVCVMFVGIAGKLIEWFHKAINL